MGATVVEIKGHWRPGIPPRLSGSELMCVVGHAPHHGRPREERDQFWNEATSKVATELEKRAEQVECVVLIDANARVGSIASSFIGSKDVGEEDENGVGLREFAESVGIHLENTYHFLGETWVNTSGSESRIDYVGLTEKLHGTAKDPRIERDFELFLSCAEDHRAFSVEVELECGVSVNIFMTRVYVKFWRRNYGRSFQEMRVLILSMIC